MRNSIFHRRLLIPSICLMAASSLAAASAAGSWNLSIQPRFDVGMTYYKMEFGNAVAHGLGAGTITTTKIELSDTVPTIGAGISIFVDRFFFDFNAQHAFSGDFSDSNVITSDGGGLSLQTNPPFSSDDFDRNELSISFGYGFSDSAVVFAGYKWAKTNFNSFSALSPAAVSFADGSGTTATFYAYMDFEFKYDGPFVGAAVGWDIKAGALTGTLSLNTAVAFLDGKSTATSGDASLRFANGGTVSLGSPADVYNTDGDSIGISLGLNWRGSTAVDGLSYSLGLNGYRYSFVAKDDGRPDIGETLLNLKIGVLYLF